MQAGWYNIIVCKMRINYERCNKCNKIINGKPNSQYANGVPVAFNAKTARCYCYAALTRGNKRCTSGSFDYYCGSIAIPN